VIVELLKDRRLLEKVGHMTKEKWVELLRSSGFTDADLARWHRDFERLDPAYHQRFLEFLGIPPDEIAADPRAGEASGLGAARLGQIKMNCSRSLSGGCERKRVAELSTRSRSRPQYSRNCARAV
jgi:hypothetical protein